MDLAEALDVTAVVVGAANIIRYLRGDAVDQSLLMVAATCTYIGARIVLEQFSKILQRRASARI